MVEIHDLSYTVVNFLFPFCTLYVEISKVFVIFKNFSKTYNNLFIVFYSHFSKIGLLQFDQSDIFCVFYF